MTEEPTGGASGAKSEKATLSRDLSDFLIEFSIALNWFFHSHRNTSTPAAPRPTTAGQFVPSEVPGGRIFCY